MALTLQREETGWLVRMEGQITLASAGELKEWLCEWLASGKDLEFDLGHVDEVDVTVLQLLWAAVRDSRNAGVRVLGRGSAAAVAAACETGFAQLPGFPLQE